MRATHYIPRDPAVVWQGKVAGSEERVRVIAYVEKLRDSNPAAYHQNIVVEYTQRDALGSVAWVKAPDNIAKRALEDTALHFAGFLITEAQSRAQLQDVYDEGRRRRWVNMFDRADAALTNFPAEVEARQDLITRLVPLRALFEEGKLDELDEHWGATSAAISAVTHPPTTTTVAPPEAPTPTEEGRSAWSMLDDPEWDDTGHHTV